MLKDRIGRRSVLKAVTGGVPALLLSRGNPGGGRVEMLKSRLDSAPPRTVCLERARLMTESYRRTEGEPALIRRAKAFGAVLEGIPIQIGAGELIVGNVASAPRIPYFATETFDWRRYRPGADQVLEDERFSKAVSIRFRIPDDIADYWHNRPAGGHVGHFVADYSRVLRSGFAGLRAEIARQDRSDGRKHDFYEAAEIACRAAELFGARYAEQAGALARRQPDPARRYELERIAETCARVPAHPARNFREALQAFWFTQVLLYINSPEWSISPGRFDQYMWPYYRQDIETGALTIAEAQELLACLWIKFNEVRVHSIDMVNYQNLIVGGMDERGADVTNELSHLCLETTRAIRHVQPSLSLRWHAGTPPALLNKACSLVLAGTGFPAFFSDAAAIASLEAAGVSTVEARDYAIAGCEELAIPGKSFGAIRGGQICQPACVLSALSRLSNLGLSGGFDQVLAVYREELLRATAARMQSSRDNDRRTAEHTPHPFASLLFDDCIRDGVDITEGGARYDLTSISEAGTITAADSLFAIKRAVFEDKIASLDQLAEALRANFKGHERLRAYLAHKTPKFGNDQDDVDLFARKVASLNHEALLEAGRRDYRGGRFVTGSGSSTAWRAGLSVGATPDGRMSGEALAVSLGPSAGADTNGPTAMLNSVAKLNWREQAGGALTHVKLPYTGSQNPVSVAAVGALIRTFFTKGGMGLHFTVVDAAMLREALREPEKHMDLIVRVGGFSAPFVLLSPDIQKNIILRTEQNFGS